MPDPLTIGGASALIIILVGVVKTTLPGFDSARFGALLSILLGVVIVVGANAASIAVHLDAVTAILTGVLAGAAAAGVYDAGKGAARTVTNE